VGEVRAGLGFLAGIDVTPEALADATAAALDRVGAATPAAM
jgi:hypothetical protein